MSDDSFLNIMVGSIIVVAGVMVLAPTFQRMFPTARYLQALQYRGILDPREIRVDSRFTWIDLIHDPPYRPWVHAFIINDGPDPVQMGINHPSDLEVLGIGETRTIDRTGADELIMSIFFVCPPGMKALVRVTGEY